MTSKRVALITGASMGLGREFARLFAADGHDVVLVARSEGKLHQLEQELESAHHVKAYVVADDLTDPSAPARIFSTVKDAGLEVEFLVNNAGFGSSGPFLELDAKRELDMVQVNVTALLHLTRLFLPEMAARRQGRVMNVASTAGFLPGPGMATYYATKAFVLSFSEAIAHELRGTGVTVTAHCPGPTVTEFGKTAGNDSSALFRMGAANSVSVARQGYRAMMKGKVVAIYGLRNWISIQLLRLAPRVLMRSITTWLNSK